MLEIMISLSDLITIVLFILGSALICYLILALSNLLRVLKNVNHLIEKNKDHIDKTVEKLPEIAENTSKITGMVKNNLNDIQHVFENVGKISDTIKKGVDTIQNDIILKAKTFLDLFDAIKRLFEKKKDGNKKKKGTIYKYRYKPGQEQPEEVEIQSSESEQQPYKDYIKVEPLEEKTEDITDYQQPDEE